MITHMLYECEFCHCYWRSEEKAMACEALGFPDPVPWLADWETRELPVFTRDRVFTRRIVSVSIRGYTLAGQEGAACCVPQHEWRLHVSAAIDNGFDDFDRWDDFDGTIPLAVLDPRSTWGVYQYTDGDVDVWAARMVELGFPFPMSDRLQTTRLREAYAAATVRAAKE